MYTMYMSQGISRWFIPVFLLPLLPLFSAAATFEDLYAGSRSGFLTGPVFPAPSSAALPPSQEPRPPALTEEDSAIKSLSEAQWDEIFRDSSGEELVLAAGQTKELFSDYHTRYVLKGFLDLRTAPPIFTSENGKVFKVVSYPKWLKKTAGAYLCVEAFAKQHDSTGSIIIKKALPLSALDGITPPDSIRQLQRTARVLATHSGGYSLGDVNWGLAHSPEGAQLKDPHGNFIILWDSVTVNTDLFEQAYFVKKSFVQPVTIGVHALLMYKFKPGGVVNSEGKSAKGLAISLDSYYNNPAHMSYSPFDALRGKYIIYYSVQTIDSFSEFKVSEKIPAILTPYPLNISRAQQLALLDNNLKKATDDNTGEMYYFFYNSCTNTVVSILNSVLDPAQKITAGWLPEIAYRVQTTLPDAVTALLNKKGMIKEPLPIITRTNYQQAFE